MRERTDREQRGIGDAGLGACTGESPAPLHDVSRLFDEMFGIADREEGETDISGAAETANRWRGCDGAGCTSESFKK